MQHLHEFLQENRDILAKTIACGRVIERERGSKTAPFTLSLPGLPAFLAEFSILQRALFGYSQKRPRESSRNTRGSSIGCNGIRASSD